MSFKPLSDRVLIDPTPVETVSQSGLITAITDTSQSPTVGVVVAVGPGRQCPELGGVNADCLMPMTIEPGDTVTWMKFAGSEITVDGRTLLLMRESDISGVIA